MLQRLLAFARKHFAIARPTPQPMSLVMEPGDTLVLQVREPLDEEALLRLREAWERSFSETAPRLIVLCDIEQMVLVKGGQDA